MRQWEDCRREPEDDPRIRAEPQEKAINMEDSPCLKSVDMTEVRRRLSDGSTLQEASPKQSSVACSSADVSRSEIQKAKRSSFRRNMPIDRAKIHFMMVERSIMPHAGHRRLSWKWRSTPLEIWSQNVNGADERRVLSTRRQHRLA